MYRGIVTLGQLRSFLAVASTGSVRRAAERLVVTQPAVSSAVASLQREVGIALVARDGRGLRLTPAGVVFAHYARRALGLLDEGLAAAEGTASPERGRVRLAAVTTAGERIVPRLLASFRHSYPDAEVVLEVGNRVHVWDLLTHHEVDLAIGGRPPGAQPFVSLATRPNTLIVVGPAGGPSRMASQEELAGATWLLREPGSGTRETAEELLRDLDVVPPVLSIGSNGAILESVRIGLGITLISRDAVGPELETGRLVEWHHPGLPLRREWHLVGRADEDLTPTARLMLDHLVGADDGFHLRP